MSKLIKGIHHVCMKCCSMEEYAKVRSFYKDILGLDIIMECEAMALFNTGSGAVEIFTNGDGHPDQGVIRHFAFDVDDTDACIETVRQAGYEVTMEPKTVQLGGDPAFEARVAFCKGPLGEEIEFFNQRW